jgi:hypothetical protein
MGMRRPTYRPDGGDGRPASHAAAAALVVGEQQHAVLEVGAEDAVLVAEEAREQGCAAAGRAEESHTAHSRAPPYGPVTKGRQGDVEDLSFHGAGDTNPMLLP